MLIVWLLMSMPKYGVLSLYAALEYSDESR